MQSLLDALLGLHPSIRYAAVYRDGELVSATRAGIGGASSAESDRYEELLVNPAILTLTTQRGNIDCGGLEFVLVRYGNFYQFVAPLPGGHVSVAIEPVRDPVPVVELIRELLRGELAQPAEP
ncbi:hypothetical protein [Thermalbibacter longus]